MVWLKWKYLERIVVTKSIQTKIMWITDDCHIKGIMHTMFIIF